MHYIGKTERIKLMKHLKRRLPKRRYRHSLGVSYTAAVLAWAHGVDQEKAMLAGLLHDYAKAMSNEEQIAYCKKHHIELTKYERRHPQVIHGKVGALMIMRRYGIKDEQVLNAIIHHTLGREGMTTLEKIVFIADYIEPERDPLPEIDAIRRIALVNLDLAMVRILESIHRHIEEMGEEIDQTARAVLAFYRKEYQHVTTRD